MAKNAVEFSFSELVKSVGTVDTEMGKGSGYREGYRRRLGTVGQDHSE